MRSEISPYRAALCRNYPQIDYQARTAIKNKARWLKMLRKANLLQEVAKQAAEQLRPGPAGAGSPGAAPAPVLA